MDLKDVRFFTLSCVGLVFFYYAVVYGLQILGIESAVFGGQGKEWQHPLDPHEPSFSKFLPEFARPYPSFEGWYVRLLDTESNFSAAMIVATNYATHESQVTLIYTPSSEDVERSKISPGDDSSSYELRTYSIAAMSKDAKFKVGPSEARKRGDPLGFEWEAPGLGKLNMTAREARLEVTVHGYTFKARLTEQILWDAKQSERGPEGWARILPLPTHWYIYTLGSRAEYEFSYTGGALTRTGVGIAHSEKNWGTSFPDGHVWFQGFSVDNSAQILGSIAYYTLGGVKTPYVGAMGYRSPAVDLDMRSVDVGIVFKNVHMSYPKAEFSMSGVSASYTIQIHAKADFSTLSEPILAPVTRTKWDFACRETFLADIDVEVYEHAVWGMVGDQRLVEGRTFHNAALEFGEDLLKT